jgi:hypothetical protein
MHGSCSFEVDMDSKLHHNNVSKESFSSPLRDPGSELMLYSGIVTSKRLRIVGTMGQAGYLGLCRDVFARYGGNDAWTVSAHVYRKFFVFLQRMYERQCWQYHQSYPPEAT